jgi:hypothetical protein
MDSIKTIRPAVLFDANKNSPGVGRAKATWWGVSYTQTPLARDEAIANGITINGLVILTETPPKSPGTIGL